MFGQARSRCCIDQQRRESLHPPVDSDVVYSSRVRPATLLRPDRRARTGGTTGPPPGSPPAGTGIQRSWTTALRPRVATTHQRSLPEPAIGHATVPPPAIGLRGYANSAAISDDPPVGRS